MSSEITSFRVPTLSWNGEGNTGNRVNKASGCPTRRSHRPCACVETPNARTGRSYRFPLCDAAMRRPAERSENVSDGNADMHADRKSDGPIVPAKRANKAGTPGAESVEERGSPKGNAWTADSPRTQSRNPREIGGHNVRRVGIVINPDRHYPREEPDEVVPHVRICAGGRR